MKKVSLIAVGTEITDGQIIDRNSSWMAQKLETLGLRPQYHFSVPDSTQEVSDVLSMACEKSDYIFICGGLGPTKDDFTRDIISQFTNNPLELNEACWLTIQKKLADRGVTVRDGHKNQAMLPKNSTPLVNNYGVAPGFSLNYKNCKLWVLPGPPRELNAIWMDNIQQDLSQITPLREQSLRTWLCLGMAESELAHLTEEHFNKFSFKKDFGYRIHLPYVEVKLWVDEITEETAAAFKSYEKLLGGSFVTNSLSDMRDNFASALRNFDGVFITDELSEGLYVSKLEDILKDYNQLPKISIQTQLTPNAPITHNISPIKSTDLVIHIQRTNDTEVKVVFIKKGKSGSFIINLPGKQISRYAKLYVLERILYEIPSIAFMSDE